MLPLDEFRKRLREDDGETGKNSGDTEWYLISTSSDPELFDKIKNDILGVESILQSLLQQQDASRFGDTKPVKRDEINKQFPSQGGWSEEGGQWLDDDMEKPYLIAWDEDKINLYTRSKQPTNMDEFGDDKMTETNVPPKYDIEALDGLQLNGSVIDEAAVGAAAHFIFREYPEINVEECVRNAMENSEDTEGAITSLQTMIPTGYEEGDVEEDPTKYTTDDMEVFNTYRSELRGKMFRDILRTEPPGVEDMEGQPGVYAQQRLQPHVDDKPGSEKEVSDDGIPGNSDGVYIANELEENDMQKAAELAAKAAEKKARNDKKEAEMIRKAEVAKAKAMKDKAKEQEDSLNEADQEATTGQLGAALAGHGPEKIGKALANMQREDSEKYQKVLNSIPKDEQLDILDYITNSGEGESSSGEESQNEVGKAEDIAGQLVGDDEEVSQPI